MLCVADWYCVLEPVLEDVEYCDGLALPLVVAEGLVLCDADSLGVKVGLVVDDCEGVGATLRD